MAPPPVVLHENKEEHTDADGDGDSSSHHCFNRSIFERKMNQFDFRMGQSDSRLNYNPDPKELDDDILSLAESVESLDTTNKPKKPASFCIASLPENGMALEKLVLSPTKTPMKKIKKPIVDRDAIQSAPAKRRSLFSFLTGGKNHAKLKDTVNNERIDRDTTDFDDFLKYSDVMSLAGDSTISEKKTLDPALRDKQLDGSRTTVTTSASSATSNKKSDYTLDVDKMYNSNNNNKKRNQLGDYLSPKIPSKEAGGGLESPLPRRGRDRLPVAPERMDTPSQRYRRCRSLTQIDKLQFADHSNLLVPPSPQQNKQKSSKSSVFPTLKPSPRETARPSMPSKTDQCSTSFKIPSKASTNQSPAPKRGRKKFFLGKKKQTRAQSLDRGMVRSIGIPAFVGGETLLRRREASPRDRSSKSARDRSESLKGQLTMSKNDDRSPPRRCSDSGNKDTKTGFNSRSSTTERRKRRQSSSSSNLHDSSRSLKVENTISSSNRRPSSRLHDSSRSLQVDVASPTLSRRSLKSNRPLSLRSLKTSEMDSSEKKSGERKRSPRPSSLRSLKTSDMDSSDRRSDEKKRSPRPGRKKLTSRHASLQNVNIDSPSSSSFRKNSLSASAHTTKTQFTQRSSKTLQSSPRKPSSCRDLVDYGSRDMVSYQSPTNTSRKNASGLADYRPGRSQSSRIMTDDSPAARRRRSRQNSTGQIPALVTTVS